MPRLDQITLKQLRALTAVVEESTILAAAERLNLTGPAVHNQLKTLEAIVGSPLLSRAGAERNIPTAQGRALLRAAAEIETSLDRAVRQIGALGQGLSGRVVLGVVSTGKYFAPRIVALLQREMPDVQVALRVGNREEIVEAMERAELDLCIMGRPPRTFLTEAMPLFDHPHIIIANQDHPLARDPMVPREALLRERRAVRVVRVDERAKLDEKLKRLLDVGFSTLVLLLGLPIWLLVALIIYVEDRGPVLYSQERVGQGGRRFTIQKYRSMRTDAEKAGISWTTQNDPRVTRVGNIIRRLHIDEIPQFWNVLIGEMSIVGPRPERPFYVEKYTELLPAYPRRLRVKPGLTGWNQVQAGEIVENVEFVRERIRHDFFYIENMSLRLDIEIIFRTILRVIQRKGQA